MGMCFVTFLDVSEKPFFLQKYDQKASRSFEDEVVGFLSPAKSRPGGIYTGLYSTAGSFLLRSQKDTEVQIGSTKLLRMSVGHTTIRMCYN